jgi:hypothetical protein
MPAEGIIFDKRIRNIDTGKKHQNALTSETPQGALANGTADGKETDNS